MKIKYSFRTIFVCSIAIIASQTFAVEVVNDDFVINGTGSTDAAYYGSSSSSAVEFNPSSIGLVSGTSGRTIHALFPTQTLSSIGEKIVFSITFSTPPTVAKSDEELRFGVFDNLGRTSPDELGRNTVFKQADPNPVYENLPGFYCTIDIEDSDPSTDLDLRKAKKTTDGTFLASSSNFERLEVLTDGSGFSSGYIISPSSIYTLTLVVERIFGTNDTHPGDELSITAELFQGDALLATQTEIDTNPYSFSYGMLGVNAGSGAVGRTTQKPHIDNGIDITSFKVTFEEDEFANW